MSNATAAAPVRATKAPAATVRPKAAPSQVKIHQAAAVKAALDETSIAAANALQFVSVLSTAIMELDDFGSLEGEITRLFNAADTHVATLAYGDEFEGPVPIALNDVAGLSAMFAAALDTLDAAQDIPRGTALIVATLTMKALDLLQRIFDAMEVSPASLAPLKELDTYAGVRPRREQPRSAIHHASANAPGLAASMSAVAQHRKAQPTPLPPVVPAAPSTATKRQRHPTELLMDQLQIGATITTMLFMNFGGDGSFDPPHEAPGVNGMVGALATAAACARRLVSEQGLPDIPQIAHASALAEHMEMLSNEKLMDGSRGFRQGDQLLGMSFWCIKTMLESAYREVEQL